MALTAGTVWQIQASATSGNLNGAGFNIANANFPTDLATDANTANTASPIVSSATYNFAAGDVGSYVYVKSGTHWQAGWYPIASVAANKATLNAAIGAVVLTIGSTGIVTRNTVVGCTSDNTATLASGTYGVDYSQQDTAVLNGLTDLTCTAGSTTVTSATGGFTKAMVGNILHATALTGTGAIVGWYELVSQTNGNNVVLDRTPTNGVNNITAGTFYVGGAGRLNGLEDGFMSMLPASSIIWVKNGTYTISGAVSTANANSTAILQSFYLGYNSVRGDTCIGANRPIIAAGANAFSFTAGISGINISFTTTSANGITNLQGYFRNGKILNTSVTAGRGAFTGGVADNLDNECISQNGTALLINSVSSASASLIGNYIHDSNIGISLAAPASSVSIIGNILEGCTSQAITIASTGIKIFSNTIYGRQAKVGTGINLSTANASFITILNNILYGLASGIAVATGSAGKNISVANDFFNNTTDVTNWIKDQTDLALDPQFVDASQLTGSTANTSGSVLTDSGASFNGNVTDGVDFLHTVSGTGVTVACYLINSHTNTTLTVNNALGTSSSNNVVYWISHGHNFQIGTNLKGLGFPNFTNVTGSQTTSYPDVGAVQRQESGAALSRVFTGM